VILKRTSVVTGAMFATMVLSMANGNSAWASLTGNGHVWNDSPAASSCMAASDDQVDADMIMWTCYDQAGQTWDFGGVPNFAAPNDNIDFTAYDTYGSCLGIASGSHSNGAWVVAESCNGNDETQDWYLKSNYEGYAIIANASENLCLSVADGSDANGAHVIVWTCKAIPTEDQMWAGPPLDL
jgi:hypothetical protein